jgi:antitoxin FitA
MPKTVQIRDIDDQVYAALKRRAAEAGLSVPDLLRREATRLAARPSMEEWLERTRRRPAGSPPATAPAGVIDALDEQRGPWPRARRSST